MGSYMNNKKLHLTLPELCIWGWKLFKHPSRLFLGFALHFSPWIDKQGNQKGVLETKKQLDKSDYEILISMKKALSLFSKQTALHWMGFLDAVSTQFVCFQSAFSRMHLHFLQSGNDSLSTVSPLKHSGGAKSRERLGETTRESEWVKECRECVMHIRNVTWLESCYFIFTELGAVAAFNVMMVITVLWQILWIGGVESQAISASLQFSSAIVALPVFVAGCVVWVESVIIGALEAFLGHCCNHKINIHWVMMSYLEGKHERSVDATKHLSQCFQTCELREFWVQLKSKWVFNLNIFLIRSVC